MGRKACMKSLDSVVCSRSRMIMKAKLNFSSLSSALELAATCVQAFLASMSVSHDSFCRDKRSMKF